MEEAFARGTGSIDEMYHRHVVMLYRICYLYVKNKYDAEDIVQNTFIRLMRSTMIFESLEHEKAWLIKTASNLCKDFHKSWWQKTVGLDSIAEKGKSFELKEDKTLQKILSLPKMYRLSLYYFYYEEYKTEEIAAILQKNESTVRSYLHRGRKMLKLELEESKNEVS